MAKKKLTVEDAIRRVQQFQKELLAQMPAISKEVTGLFISLKLSAIKKRGIGNYSSRKYAASYLKGKELTGSGRAFIAAKIKAKQKTNWAELRGAQGLKTRFVDFYYSGQTLNSIGIIKTSTSGNKFIVNFGARNPQAAQKLSQGIRKYGNFMQPDEQQAKVMRERAEFLISKIYKRVILNT